ncbi:MAG: ATP-dependent helicase [Lachnospiraceae bacterium]|nr:ATP-dependent helicase [Ruminococcus sp.]MCM1276417.1 ATP-dependent helicase [Lachnospiraceae bacterium]
MLTSHLSEKQIEAVNAIDEDVEIIACAGAGKTGVVARRIINILKSKPDVSTSNIVAFTFTKKAAEELKSRIYKIGEDVLGNTKGFADMYIGTIHGFCIKVLQEYLPEFQPFTVLDEVHTKLFAERYYDSIGMTDLGLMKYTETNLFISVMSMLNENWSDADKWSADVRTAFEKYRETLYAEKYFDYSLILRETVEQFERNSAFRALIAERVKYLTVDEYQDTNPIQERLISLLRGLGAKLCVVGDDDQTIYQFRGSDANNIITFVQRYDIRKYIVLDTDYRSTSGIVDVARNIIGQNSNRLPKEMRSGCSTVYDKGDVVYKEFEHQEDEYEFIAENVRKLHDVGVPYSEMAILLRKRKIGADIAEVLEENGIPFVIEGVNELMQTKECRAAKGIFDYLNGELEATALYKLWQNVDYPFDKKELSDSLQSVMTLDVTKMKNFADLNLQQVYQDFLKGLSINENENPQAEIILYNLGKFSQVIGDYEVINFTRKPRSKLSGFCSFLKYTAEDYYPEGYLTNSFTKPDAVSIMTVHQSKGLEFAAVFIPGLNKNFFPAQRVGGKSVWHVIERSYITGSSRFDGDIEDERKLFYVAVTRAKKFLFLSRAKDGHDKNVSTFLAEAKSSAYLLPYDDKVVYNAEHLPEMKADTMPLTLNFSLLEDYFECPYRFKLSMFYGFVQPLTALLGYGNTIHAIVGNINRAAIEGKPITEQLVKEIFDKVFFLPYAIPAQRERMLKSAERSVKSYIERYGEHFGDIRFAEKDIELDIGDGITVNGRIDMVKDEVVDGETRTVIVDFKSANKKVIQSLNSEQLKIYALGYERLTGRKADFVEIHQLDTGGAAKEALAATAADEVIAEIKDAAAHIRGNDLPRRCSTEKCSKCRSRHLCLSKAEQRKYV